MAGLLDLLLRAHLNGPDAAGVPAVPADDTGATDFEDALLAEEQAKRRAAAAKAALPAAAAPGIPMAGILGAAGMPGAAPGAGFSSPYDEANPAAEAQAAREAAAKTLSRSARRSGPFTGAENAPLPFAGMMGSAGLLNAPGGGQPEPQAAPVGSPDAPPDLPPSTNDPTANEPQVFANGVPLPRPKPISPQTTGAAPLSMAPGGDEAGLPPKGQLAGPADPTAGGGIMDALGKFGGGLVDKVGNVIGNMTSPDHAATMLALGAGFSGSPSFGTGMRRAFAGAAPAVAADRANQIKQTGIAASYRALVAKGVPPAEALAAVYNPEVMKATASKYFETKPMTVHDITGPLGDKTPVVFDPNKGKFFGMDGKPVDSSGAAMPGGPEMGSLLAPGVKYDPNATGDAYMNQFSKDVQAAAKAYMNGDVLPTGNARQKSISTFAKTVAQRYGADMGIPVSDADFSQKRKYRMELGSNSANTAGGQAKAFNQGIEHMDALATELEKLGNWNGLGIPMIAGAANSMRQGMSTQQAGIAAQASRIGQTLAGEVGKLFSGSQGGGVHERDMTRKAFDTVKSGPEMAGALEGTLETMKGGLAALEQRRDAVLGPAAPSVQFLTDQTKAKIARIEATIARLRGQPAPDAATGAPMPVLKPGASTVINGVTIKRLN